MPKADDPRSRLPGVDTLLERSELSHYRGTIATPLLSRIVRRVLAEARTRVQEGADAPLEHALTKQVVAAVESLLHAGPRRVINATGVILHTGLGRAPLSDAAVAALEETARYCDLEFDLVTGGRGDRQSHVEGLLCWVTGAEAALVVNNNAAALYLVLNALAFRKEVVVSRGQLIEIGGSFRLPEIMARAGCKLVEVGTTNRTRLADFQAATNERTCMVLRAYPSNFRIDGFTESVAIKELADLARSRGVICVDDLGGGLLWDWTEHGLPYEPSVAESLEDGADLVLVSGDKVIGGPQAGLILGRKALVEKLKKSPLARVLRPGKLELAALAATLRSFLHHNRAPAENPTWNMLFEQPAVTVRRAEQLRELVVGLAEWSACKIVEMPAQAGSGTLPAVPLKSYALALLPKGKNAARWARDLRTASVAVVPVVQDDVVLLNLRTIRDYELPDVERAIRESLS